MGIERRKKKCICLILQSDSSQQISLSQCHSIMNSPSLFWAFCCHAAASCHTHWTWNIFWATARGSLSLSLSLSLALPWQIIDNWFFPPSLCPFPSLPLSTPKKPVTPPPPPPPPPHPPPSPSTLCWVRDRDDGGNGRFWLTKMLRCNLEQAEMWSVCLLCVCVCVRVPVREGKGWGNVWCSVYCIASSFVCILYLISAQTSRLHIPAADDPVSQHCVTPSLSLII